MMPLKLKKFRIFIAQRLWKIYFLLIILMLIFNYDSKSPRSSFYTSRLRPQNLSTYHFFKFRDLSMLTNTCEQMTTIDCLTYLHNNQSDYFQPLSPIEYDFFQNNYCTNKKKMLFHTFWDNPKNLNDPLLLLHIQSHLYTQNRQCSNLIIWTVPPFSGEIDPIYNVHAPYLQFRTLMPLAKELRQVGVNIESFWFWLFGGPVFVGMGVVSDAIRFVVLHKFGGIYIDADILLLRDLQPFYSHEFAYRWSTVDQFNTAVLQLHPQSNISSKLIDLARQKRSLWIFFPTSIKSHLYPLTLNRLPCIFFDPLWLVADSADQKTANIWNSTGGVRQVFETVFRRSSELSRQGRTVFNGAFAFHWHALHRAGIFERGSFLYQWNEFLDLHLLKRI